MRLIDHFDKFNSETRDSLAYSTRMIHYRQAVRAYAECFGEAVDVNHITAESLEQFRQWWLEQPHKRRGSNRTEASAQRYCQALQMIAEHCPLVENSLISWTKQHGQQEDEAAVQRLQKMLGRDVAVDELTTELINRFDAWLDSQELAASTKQKHKRLVRRIAHKAAGLVMPSTPQGSLQKYFEQFSIENRDSLSYTTRTIHYRQAVRAYAECFGEAVGVDHITAESLEQFRQWWLKQPSKQPGKTRTDKTARRYCRTLRMIAAHADPSKFPEQRTGLFPLVEGSLTTWTKENGKREDEATISRLKMMLGRDLTVEELTADLIERFDVWLDGQDLSPATKQKRKSGIRLIARKSLGLIIPSGTATKPETPDGSLRQLLELYREAKPDTAKTTIGIYRTSIKRFAEYLGREPMLDDLTDERVGSWLEDRAKHAAEATVICNRRCIIVLWRFAFFADLVDRHPKRWRSHAILATA